MNGAESLARTLLACGVDTCFANPGTSEMHFVAALDRVEGMRCVLGLAETVVTGCADGYARMAGRPAATLLHCGPGFANGIANLHNARRGNAPVVNVIGDHATYHRPFDPPLAADTVALAQAVSHWVRVAESPQAVADAAAAAVQAAITPPGRIASLVLPADAAWGEGAEAGGPVTAPSATSVDEPAIAEAARILRSGSRATLQLAGSVLSEEGLRQAQRVAHASGARLVVPTQVSRMARGRGRPPVDRIPYNVDAALRALADVQDMILVGATKPVAFFAYPGKPSLVTPPETRFHVLSRPAEDGIGALRALADALGAPGQVPMPVATVEPQVGKGAFEPLAFASTLAALLPQDAVVVEEGVTSGRALFPPTFNAAPHDWLQITGGAIGHGLPCATGAAVGAPGRKVVCLQADGGGMYSLQALWTQARERLDVVNVIFANGMYRILHGELQAVGAQPGRASGELFDLTRPALDWVKMAAGMGVEGTRVESLEGFADAFRAACARPGPFLIEFRF